MQSNGRTDIFDGIDFKTVAIYIALTIIGAICITSASFDESSTDICSMSHFYMKQIVWVGAAWATAFVIMLLDSRYFHMLAYPAYLLGILALVAVLLFGREVNGAKAWFQFGSIRVQPVEFAKIAIALAVARMMSGYSFSINKAGDLFRLAAILILPLAIIILQNDTGSGIVLGSFIITPPVLLISLILLFTLSEAMMNRLWRSRIMFLAAIFFTSIVLYGVLSLFETGIGYYRSLLITSVCAVIVAAIYAYRSNLRNIFVILALFLSSMIFLPTADFVFSSILKPHQQNRILNFLGLVDDLRDTGYNVNQSKIAIGSGGLTGKGLMNGTQIKYNFVPEKHTDFIFCTIGEEWGFLGALVVLGLLCALILRLMKMGDRHEEPFGRVYCYCVASILLFHVLVNVGMTIGLMPVMGIPLPFVSYGGSSLIAFTVMLFIAVNLDASTRQQIDRYR